MTSVEMAKQKIRKHVNNSPKVQEIALGILDVLAETMPSSVVVHYDMLMKTNIQVYDGKNIITESNQDSDVAKKLHTINAIILNDQEDKCLKRVLSEFCILEEYRAFSKSKKARKDFLLRLKL